jgi:hypothetical protein
MEVAKLSHSAGIINVSWMDGDAGVVSLAEDGIVSKWTRVASSIAWSALLYLVRDDTSSQGSTKWVCGRILDAGKTEDEMVCLAYMRDRIAVSFSRMGVKVWMWSKGVPSRSLHFMFFSSSSSRHLAATTLHRPTERFRD